MRASAPKDRPRKSRKDCRQGEVYGGRLARCSYLSFFADFTKGLTNLLSPHGKVFARRWSATLLARPGGKLELPARLLSGRRAPARASWLQDWPARGIRADRGSR